MDHYAFDAQITAATPIGLSTAGLRVDLSFTGTITEGPLAGSKVDGTDWLLIRHDGIGQITVRERIIRDGRTAASLQFSGYVVPPITLPDLSELSAPDFPWPDIAFPLHGASFCEAADKEIASATATVYGVTGAVNLAQGTLRVAARSLAVSSPVEAVTIRDI
ncbi:MAG: hypothetical protein ABWY93_33590 [Mycobacterium sp.]